MRLSIPVMLRLLLFSTNINVKEGKSSTYSVAFLKRSLAKCPDKMSSLDESHFEIFNHQTVTNFQYNVTRVVAILKCEQKLVSVEKSCVFFKNMFVFL